MTMLIMPGTVTATSSPTVSILGPGRRTAARRLESRIAAGADVGEIRPLLVKAIEQRYGLNDNARMSAET